MNTTHKGKVIFPDLAVLKSLDKGSDMSQYEYYDVEARITIHPTTGYKILLFDLPNDEFDWGGNFKCFLYEDDKKMLGKWHYLKEANLPDLVVDGEYEMMPKNVWAKGLLLEAGKPVYGLYVTLEEF